MNNVVKHTATVTNQQSHAPLGERIFDVDTVGNKTFDQAGAEVFTQTFTQQQKT